MIYNLWEYVRAQFPTHTFYTNGYMPSSVNTSTLINEAGGESALWYNRTVSRFQFVTRAQSSHEARTMAYSYFMFLRKKWNITLPAVVVDTVTYPSVVAHEITCISDPEFLGYDDNQLAQYVFNIYIIWRGV